jgi:hypothetical protein
LWHLFVDFCCWLSVLPDLLASDSTL